METSSIARDPKQATGEQGHGMVPPRVEKQEKGTPQSLQSLQPPCWGLLPLQHCPAEEETPGQELDPKAIPHRSQIHPTQTPNPSPSRSQIHPHPDPKSIPTQIPNPSHADPPPQPWLDTVSKDSPHFCNFRDLLSPPSVCCPKRRSARGQGEVVAPFPILERISGSCHIRGAALATLQGWHCTGPCSGASSSRNINSQEQDKPEIKPRHK